MSTLISDLNDIDIIPHKPEKSKKSHIIKDSIFHKYKHLIFIAIASYVTLQIPLDVLYHHLPKQLFYFTGIYTILNANSLK